MCRLFGAIARDKAELATYLLETQRPLIEAADTNPDGWGMCWYNGTDRPQIYREPTEAGKSPEFRRHARSVDSPLVITHLRKAHVGDVRYENTHPFTDGRVAFAHNGNIGDRERLLDALEPGRRERIRGATDSEVYFQLLMQNADGDIATCVGRTSDFIGEELDEETTSINFVMSDGERLYAYKNSLSPDDEHPLHYAAHGEQVTVSTDRLDDNGWKALRDGELLTVDRELGVERTVI